MVSRVHTLRYITHEDLAHLLLSRPQDVLVVDGGKIPGSVNIPLAQLTENPKAWEDLKSRFQGCKMTVFHCYYSQSRAPAAAKWVIEKLGGRVLSPNPTGSPSSSSSSNAKEEGELPVDVRVLQSGWWQWNEKYNSHPQLYEPIHHHNSIKS